jgi:hypothetical protein
MSRELVLRINSNTAISDFGCHQLCDSPVLSTSVFLFFCVVIMSQGIDFVVEVCIDSLDSALAYVASNACIVHWC